MNLAEYAAHDALELAELVRRREVAPSELGALAAEGSARVNALREVSFDVFAGTVVGLRGPSGSGKSTLLNVIGCILEPNSGSMRLNGELVYDGRWLRKDLRGLRLEKIAVLTPMPRLIGPGTCGGGDMVELMNGRPRGASRSTSSVSPALLGGA